jgi:hypothetical protein
MKPKMEGSNSQQPARKELQGQDQGTGAPRKEPWKFCAEHRGRGDLRANEKEHHMLRRNPQEGGGKQQPARKEHQGQGIGTLRPRNGEGSM